MFPEQQENKTKNNLYHNHDSFILELFLMYFKPSNYVESLLEVNFEILKKQGTNLILLDLDNTLAPHFTKIPTNYAKTVIEKIKAQDIEVIIVSNNNELRVSRFAKLLDVKYLYNTKKPFIKKIRKKIEENGYKLEETLMIGDMIIMDIFAANRLKIDSLLVKPILSYNVGSTKKMNWIETNIFKRLKRDNLIIKKNSVTMNLYDKEYEIF